MKNHQDCEHFDCPGHNRQCEILANVPAEHHEIYGQEATYLTNVTGGKRSDNLAKAVQFGLAGLTSPTAIKIRDAR